MPIFSRVKLIIHFHFEVQFVLNESDYSFENLKYKESFVISCPSSIDSKEHRCAGCNKCN